MQVPGEAVDEGVLAAVGLVGNDDDVPPIGEQLVAVGEDDERRVGERRQADDLPDEEGHRQALAAALRVPDNADALVPLGRGRLHRTCDGLMHGVELVEPGQLLDDVLAVVLEDDEMAEARTKFLVRTGPSGAFFDANELTVGKLCGIANGDLLIACDLPPDHTRWPLDLLTK